MTEIKSTIDLVMERTKGMFQTEEEKLHVLQEEREKKIKGLLLGITDARLNMEDLAEALKKDPADEPEIFRRMFFGKLVDSIDLESGPEWANAVDFLTDGKRAKEISELKEIIDSYRSKNMEWEDQATNRVLDELAAKGISGTALQPISEIGDDIRQAREDLKAGSLARLSELKRVIVE